MDGDFPILCSECIGENPYVRMIKIKHDEQCKMCMRPTNVYRWKNKGKNCKTAVCQTCAKLRNLCRGCVRDLQFGLPVHIRDAGLALSNAAAASSTTDVAGRDLTSMSTALSSNAAQREHFLEMAEAEMESGKSWSRDGVANIVGAYQQSNPAFQRNRNTLCTFFLRGLCTKGAACPFRHEMPKNAKAKLEAAKAEDEAKRAEIDAAVAANKEKEAAKKKKKKSAKKDDGEDDDDGDDDDDDSAPTPAVGAKRKQTDSDDADDDDDDDKRSAKK